MSSRLVRPGTGADRWFEIKSQVHQKLVNSLTPDQLKDLLKIKASLGIPDPRHGLKECELCDNAEWRPGVACALPAKDAPAVGLDADAEAMVKVITDQLLAQMK